MESNLLIELVYQESPTAKEDEAAAMGVVTMLFTERILKAARLEMGMPEENGIDNGKDACGNNN